MNIMHCLTPVIGQTSAREFSSHRQDKKDALSCSTLDVRNNLWCAKRSTSNDIRRPGKTSHSLHVELAIKTACCSSMLQYRVPCGVLGMNWLDAVQYVCESERKSERGSHDMRFQGIVGRKVPIELALLLVNRKNHSLTKGA